MRAHSRLHVVRTLPDFVDVYTTRHGLDKISEPVVVVFFLPFGEPIVWLALVVSMLRMGGQVLERAASSGERAVARRACVPRQQ